MMRKAIFGGTFLVLVFFGNISTASPQHRTMQGCVEVEMSEINREISRLKSRCDDEMRYITNCIRNQDNARGSRDRSRSKGDWHKLKKSLKSRCERELAALNRQKSEVWKLCRDMVDIEKETDILGSVWQTTDAGIDGTWKRRGESNVFDGKWSDGAVAELTITLSGNNVRIQRKDMSGPNPGQVIEYEGAISPDGKTASGTFKSMAGQGPWSATITP